MSDSAEQQGGPTMDTATTSSPRDDRQSVLAKIARLLRLAQSDNPNEAALAASRAQELMDRHAVSEAMLDADASEPDEPIVHFSDPDDALDDLGRRGAVWKGCLARLLAHHNACEVYHDGPRLVLVGRPTDASAVRYLYAFCVRETERLVAAQGSGHGRTWYNNYRLGVVDAIASKLRSERRALHETLRTEAQATDDGSAIVKVSTALTKIDARKDETQAWVRQHVKLRSAGRSSASFDRGARERGQEDGASISLGSKGAIGAGTSRQLGSGR